MKLSEIVFLGVGIGYRNPIGDWIFSNKVNFDFIEIISELYQNVDGFDRLRRLCDTFKVIPHGVDLSIGSLKLNEQHLQNIKYICEITKCPYYSEHLAIVNSSVFNLGHLSPLWFTEEMLKIITFNVNKVQDFIERPLILENIASNFVIPNGFMSEEEFFCRLIENTGCGLLLDVTNIYINAHNHSFDPYDYINRMPLGSLIQIHISGSTYTQQDELLDSHNCHVNQQSWKLLQYVKEKANIKAVLLEFDKEFPDDLNELLSHVNMVKKLLNSRERFYSYNN